MRAVAFIDGSNFYFKLRELTDGMRKRPNLLSFQTREFVKYLVVPHLLVETRYYIGAMKRQRGNEKSEKMYADQQRLISKLAAQGVIVILGQIIQHPDKTHHEKGVDVRVAVEMIRLARQDTYDIAYLISSDTDLVPAVEEVHSFGKRIVYVGTAKSQSFGLSKVSDDTRLIRPEEITAFLPAPLL